MYLCIHGQLKIDFSLAVSEKFSEWKKNRRLAPMLSNWIRVCIRAPILNNADAVRFIKSENLLSQQVLLVFCVSLYMTTTTTTAALYHKSYDLLTLSPSSKRNARCNWAESLMRNKKNERAYSKLLHEPLTLRVYEENTWSECCKSKQSTKTMCAEPKFTEKMCRQKGCMIAL